MSVSLHVKTTLLASLVTALSACNTPAPTPPAPLPVAPKAPDLASFPCEGALPAVHRQVCASDALARLDRQVVEQYRSQLRTLDLPEALLLEANQRQWLLSRAGQCQLVEQLGTAIVADPPAIACLEAAYRQRAQQLASGSEVRPEARQGTHALSAYAEFRLVDNRDPTLCGPMTSALNQDLARHGLPAPARLPGATALAGSQGPAASALLDGMRVAVDLYDAGPYAGYQLRARGLSLDGRPVVDDRTLPAWVAEQPNYGGRAHASSSQTGDYASLDVFRQNGRTLLLINETWGFYSPAAPGESAYAGLYALDRQGAQPLCLYQSYLTPPRSNTLDGLPAFAALQAELDLLAGDPPPRVARHERLDNALSWKERQWTLLNMPLLGADTLPAREGALRQRHDESLNRLFDWSERNLENKRLYRRLLPLLQPAHGELLQLFAAQGLDATQARAAADLLVQESLARASEALALPEQAPALPLPAHADYSPRYAVAPAPGDLEQGRSFATLHSVLLNNAPLPVVQDFIAYETEQLGEQRGRGANNDSALMAAINNPEHLDLLLLSGFEANQRNAWGKTPLMAAAQFNQLGSTRALLAKGADVHGQTRPQPDIGIGGPERRETTQPRQTALLIAARQADAGVIGALEQAGALREEWAGYGQQVCGALDGNPYFTPGQHGALKATLCAAYAPAPASASASTAGEAQALAVELLERPVMTLFGRRHTLSPAALPQELRGLATNLGMAAVRRAKVKIIGPLTLVLPDLAGNTTERVSLDLNFPVSSGALVVPNYRLTRTEPTRVLSTVFDPQRNDMAGTWQALHAAALARGLTPANQGYVVIQADGSAHYQLQVTGP
ncbi:MAG: ankyrin repeat domain-containing protein [Pseudomonadota bacterium]